MCIFRSETAKENVQLLLNIFFMLKIVRLLLKENVQMIFFYVEDCVAASANISTFFEERATTSEKILRKNVLLLLEENVQLLLRITVNPKINARGVYLIFGIFRGRLLEGGV